jgi:hypothetical protein
MGTGVAMAVESELGRLERFGYEECWLYVTDLGDDGVRVSYQRHPSVPPIEFRFDRDLIALERACRRIGTLAANPQIVFGWYEAKCLAVVLAAVRDCWKRTDRARHVA